VKNYNLSNPKFNDIGLLSGVGLLALLNQEARFVNHWLNISPLRIGGPKNSNQDAPTNLKNKVDEDMKLVIAYRALAGGRTTGRDNKHSLMAKIFIINDNSTGKFKVFRISDILNNISNNLDMLHITTQPDLFSMKNIWEGEDSNNADNAYKRVT
jgi:hypothetical protein